MTPKSLIHIDLTEITFIEIACKKCKSVSSVPIPALYLAEELRCCGCNALLWGKGVQEAGSMVKQLIDVLDTWKKFHSKTNFTLGFSLDSEPSRVSGEKD
jgi:predicted nucleic-acid-binding Zn-ribbon protein